jgi:tripartite-type tricarboxylate transporter receptor subunit TctC
MIFRIPEKPEVGRMARLRSIASETEAHGAMRAPSLPIPALLIAAGIAAATIAPAASQTPSEFFQGKTIRVIIATGAGASYDVFGRLVARHLGEFLPGKPSLIAENMPGADGIKAANYLFSVAPKDGTVIATFNSAIAFYEAMAEPGIQFRGAELSWIGSLPQDPAVIAVFDSPVRSIEEARRSEVVIGATGATGTMAGYPALMNSLFGTRFRIVTGYDGGNAVNLAMERGEVQGRGNSTWSAYMAAKPDWVREGRIVPLVQIGPHKDPELPDVPLLNDLARSQDERQMLELVSSTVSLGQPFAAPPGIPADRLAALREAFARMGRDKAFKADAMKQAGLQHDIEPIPAAEVEGTVRRTVATPRILVERVRAAMDVKEAKKAAAP